MITNTGTVIDKILSLNLKNLRSAYLIIGDDLYLEHLTISKLIDEFEKKYKHSVEKLFFYGKLEDSEAFFQSLSNVGMFAAEKVLVYRDINQLPRRYWQMLFNYLAHPSPEILVIMTSLLEERNELTENLKNFREVEYLETRTPFENQYPQVVELLISKDNVEIDRDALALLVDLTNDSLAHTMGEWEKILLYLGDRKKVTNKDVMAVVGGTKKYDIWDLHYALAKKSVQQVLLISKSLIESDQKLSSIIISFYEFFLWLFMLVCNKEVEESLKRKFDRYRRLVEKDLPEYRQKSNFGNIFRALRRADLLYKSTSLKELDILVPLISEIMVILGW